MGRVAPPLGTTNVELIRGWVHRTPNEDGPFWALSLMKYREFAHDECRPGAALTGDEAADADTRLGPLRAVGALVALHGDVRRQSGSTPDWDQVRIVRYPSRAAFLKMQERDDFKRQHKHEDAGMEFTIVMSCEPDRSAPALEVPDGSTLVVRIAFTPAGTALPPCAGAMRVAAFDVEGVIVGDDRTWSTVAFDAAPTSAVMDALLAGTENVDEIFALVLAPCIDQLAASITSAASSAAVGE